jgi:hypothetical protein
MHQVSEKHVQKHQLQQQRALQRQHIEVTIVTLSGCRLCAALAHSQSTGEPAGTLLEYRRTQQLQLNRLLSGAGCWLDVAAVTLVYILALVLEFGAGRLGMFQLSRQAVLSSLGCFACITCFRAA